VYSQQITVLISKLSEVCTYRHSDISFSADIVAIARTDLAAAALVPHRN